MLSLCLLTPMTVACSTPDQEEPPTPKEALLRAANDGAPEWFVDATVAELETPYLDRWRVLYAVADDPTRYPHPPLGWYAINGEHSQMVPLGSLKEWNQVLKADGGAPGTADEAALLAEQYARTLQTNRTLVTVLRSIDDVPFIKNHRDVPTVKAKYRSRVTPPSATKHGNGWAMEVWMTHQRELVLRRMTFSSGRGMADSPEVVDAEMPVGVAT